MKRITFLMNLVFLILINLLCIKGQEPTKYMYGLMKIFFDSNPQQDGIDFCFNYPSEYFTFPTDPTKFYKLENKSEIDPCESLNEKDLQQKSNNDTLFLMKSYENCTLMNYVNYTHNENGSGLVLISELRKASQNYSLDAIAIISNETANEIFGLWTGTSDPRVQLYLVNDSAFEGSILVLWVVACICVAIGSLTGPYHDLHNSHQQILDNGESPQEPKNVQINFNIKLVLILVMFISGTLLLLYFFYSYLVYFFMAVFCIASGRATYEILNQITNLCNLGVRMPKIKNCGIHQIILGVICAALPITWFVLRHNPYIWILQDILGICFCIHLIQTLRIPNLKICTVLLSLLFFYDIFFVFITPYFTSDGKSVMVEVATGGGSEESLPLLIKIPHLRHGPLSVCGASGYSLLGFGDIILPGFLVCFAHAFDVVRGDKYRPYFITGMLGYAAGLCFAFVALYLSQTGQPALLYIVPATLIPIHTVAFFRKQTQDLWRGTISITEIEP